MSHIFFSGVESQRALWLHGLWTGPSLWPPSRDVGIRSSIPVFLPARLWRRGLVPNSQQSPVPDEVGPRQLGKRGHQALRISKVSTLPDRLRSPPGHSGYNVDATGLHQLAQDSRRRWVTSTHRDDLEADGKTGRREIDHLAVGLHLGDPTYSLPSRIESSRQPPIPLSPRNDDAVLLRKHRRRHPSGLSFRTPHDRRAVVEEEVQRRHHQQPEPDWEGSDPTTSICCLL